MKITAKYLLAALLACGASSMQANYDEYASESRGGCCFGGCYECGCNPLYCGAWDLQIDGGVEPVIWRDRGPIVGLACVADVATPFNIFDKTPKFNHLFKIPWTVGGQVGYHWSDNTRIYVEFDYVQAKAKNHSITPTGSFTSFDFGFTKYELFEAYVGARYYWDRWCDRVSFFLGGKVGLAHHKRIRSTLVTVPANDVVAGTEWYHSSTVVSGGADFGFDVCFCGNWSFVVTGSVLASAGPRTNHSNEIAFATPSAGLNGFLINDIGSELRFPVTFGIRYSF